MMNGTSVMTGIGIVNTINTRRLLNWVILCSSAINEIVQAYDDHLSEALNHTKKTNILSMKYFWFVGTTTKKKSQRTRARTPVRPKLLRF